MIRRILFAIDVAVLTTVVYALTAADCWPPTAAAHLALVRAGVVTGAVGSYYPVWGWCVARFGLNAVTLSALAGGCAAGLLMWNVARIKGVRGGLVSAAIFAFAPTVWRAGTQVDSSLFDLSFLLLALAFAGGKRWKLKMPIALLAAGTYRAGLTGTFTEETERALHRFCARQGLPWRERLDGFLWNRLLQAAKKAPDNADA